MLDTSRKNRNDDSGIMSSTDFAHQSLRKTTQPHEENICKPGKLNQYVQESGVAFLITLRQPDISYINSLTYQDGAIDLNESNLTVQTYSVPTKTPGKGLEA